MKIRVEDRTDGFKSYAYKAPVTSTRTNLNDLLKRVKEQKKNDKKINLSIFFGVTSVLAIIFLLFSI